MGKGERGAEGEEKEKEMSTGQINAVFHSGMRETNAPC